MFVQNSYVLTAVITPDPDGGYVAQIAELPGAISQGETVEEAVANVQEVAELYLEDATDDEIAALGAHPMTTTVQVAVA